MEHSQKGPLWPESKFCTRNSIHNHAKPRGSCAQCSIVLCNQQEFNKLAHFTWVYSTSQKFHTKVVCPVLSDSVSRLIYLVWKIRLKTMDSIREDVELMELVLTSFIPTSIWGSLCFLHSWRYCEQCLVYKKRRMENFKKGVRKRVVKWLKPNKNT